MEDLRVPLISSLFCIFVTIGGILLVIYVFVPNHSQPWFPSAALTLIALPWIFWLFTYMYTCMKRCFCSSSSNIDNRQISRRSSSAATAMSNPGNMTRNVSTANSTRSRDDNDGKNDQSGGGGGGTDGTEHGLDQHGGRQERGDGSIDSSKEIEVPLTLSVGS